MTIRTTLWLALLAGCTSSTGSEPGAGAGSAKPLTCAIITGPNCWTDALANVAACAPDRTDAGVLSADAATCTYDSGDTATFQGGVTMLGNNVPFAFSLTVGGALCAEFSLVTTPSTVETLRTSLGVASWTMDDNVTLSCPDGTMYQTDIETATRCSDLATVGWVDEYSAASFSFSFLAKGGNIEVLDCAM